MSGICTVALALGIGLAVCDEPALDAFSLPVENPDVWDHEPRKPDPVVVEVPVEVEVVKEVEVYVERPAVEPVEEVVEELPEAVVSDSKRDEAWRRYYLHMVNGSRGTLRSTDSVGGSGGGGIQDFPRDTKIAASAPVLEAGVYKHPSLASGSPVDNEDILTEDRYIAGHLETSINTQLDGTVIIQTSRDIFGYHGRRILLAKGSRMVCDYTAPKKIGIHRVGLFCDRILTSEDRLEIYQVKAPVGDIQGRVGITGDVDNRFLESYGSAFVLTIISASVRAAIAAGTNPGSSDTEDVIIREAGEEVSTRFGEITAAVLEKTIDLRPIITIPQGTRVQVRPASDWVISKR